MIYFIVLFLILMCVWAYDYRRHEMGSSFFYWFLYFLLVVIAGLRYRIGIDSIVYESIYEDVPTLAELGKFQFDKIRYEPGFMVFASLPRSISSDFTLLQIFQAIVVNLVVFLFIKANTRNKFFCLLLYYIVLYLNLTTQVMREALSLCCFLLAWPYFRDGKWLKYYLLMLFATFLHTSALLTLIFPIFTIPGIRNGFKLGWQVLIIGVVVLGIGFVIQQNFYNFFMMISVSGRMADRVMEYSTDADAGQVLNILGSLDLCIRNILFPVLAIYFLGKKVRREGDIHKIKEFEKLQVLVITSVYLTLMTIPMFIFGRYYNYLGLFNFIAISRWVFSYLNIGRKVYRLRPAYWFLVLLPFFFFQFKSYMGPINKSGSLRTYMIYYPYNSRIDMERDPNREALYKYYGVR